jgi:hypothetical protein
MTSTAALRQARHTARRYAAHTADAHVRAELERHGLSARPHRPFRMRLWLPVSLLWIFFPLVVLLSPLAAAWRANPARVVTAVAAVLAGLSGVCVDVESADADIRIRLF